MSPFPNSCLDDLKCVQAAETLLKDELNPPRFQKKAAEVFPGSPRAETLDKGFHHLEWTYHTVSPDETKLPPRLRAQAEDFLGQPVTVPLKVFASLPKTLLNTRGLVKLAIRWHGGGGFTGHPRFLDWTFQDEQEFVLNNTMISVEPGYPFLPHSTGAVIRECPRHFWNWAIKSLQNELWKVNEHLIIDWSHVYIFGASFGGKIALYTFLDIIQHHSNPLNFRLRVVFVRCPITRRFSRAKGPPFMGEFVDEEETTRVSNVVVETLQKTPWLVPRTSITPPGYMYGAFVTSTTNRFGDLWGEKFPYECIEDTTACADLRTKFFFFHGSDDQHVDYQDTLDTAALLKRKWPGLQVKVSIQLDKGHCWDYGEQLTQEMESSLLNDC